MIDGIDFHLGHSKKIKAIQGDIFAKFSDRGTTHPNLFIVNAPPGDSARRLAFLVIGECRDGIRYEF
jgi:hypothetical protein